MNPILKGHFNNFKKTWEIVTTIDASGQISTEKESRAFETFVNYVLFSSDYPEIFTGDEDLLDFVCVGGNNDTGIDGIGIKINDRLVRSVDEVKEIVQDSKKINVDFVFIQSKMRPHFDGAEFSSFGTGIKIFFAEGCLPENEKIRAFRDIKDFIYSDEKVISKLDKNPSLFVYYILTGNEPTDGNSTGSQQWLQKELVEGHYFEKVQINVLGEKQLIKFCRELDNKFEVQLNIIDIFPLIVDVKTDIKKSYAFTCSANEFVKILQKDDGALRRSLFNSNVRDYLGNKGAINSEIESTIVDDPEMFLLCNNGVTIVCSNFEQIRDKLVKIENPQIVNGCQTSNSIFNFKHTPNMAKVQLLVRLISTDDFGITNKILRGTNKQNQVLDEAFEVTFPFHQEILEPFFLSFESENKIFYERRAKQYNNDPLIKKTQIVNLRILTQTFVSMFLNSPHESHRHEAKLLMEYASDKDDRMIFKEDHDPYPYYLCALTWYMFEKFFREDRINKRYKTYKAHLYLILRLSVGEYPPKLNTSKPLKVYCDKLLSILQETTFQHQVIKVTDLFDEAAAQWSETRSRFGIKDSKDFTELLLKLAREHFMKNQPLISDKKESAIFEGTIFTVKWSTITGHWFGFIKRGYRSDNVYFDSRGYKGEVRHLIPDTKVKFEISSNEKGPCAKNVKLL